MTEGIRSTRHLGPSLSFEKEKKDFIELGANYMDEKKREAQLKYYQKRIEELGAGIPENKSA